MLLSIANKTENNINLSSPWNMVYKIRICNIIYRLMLEFILTYKNAIYDLLYVDKQYQNKGTDDLKLISSFWLAVSVIWPTKFGKFFLGLILIQHRELNPLNFCLTDPIKYANQVHTVYAH